MKKIVSTTGLLFLLCLCSQAQSKIEPVQKDAIRVLFENEKMKVTEYTSTPGHDVCGKGKHTHAAHLDIAITDITGSETGEDGKTENFELKAGDTHWNKAGTHVALNTGKKPAILYIV